MEGKERRYYRAVHCLKAHLCDLVRRVRSEVHQLVGLPLKVLHVVGLRPGMFVAGGAAGGGEEGLPLMAGEVRAGVRALEADRRPALEAQEGRWHHTGM